MTEDLVDQAIHYVENHKAAAPERPYFLYLAIGACHWPHHVPKDLIARYQGRYAGGWDAIREERFGRQKAMGVVPQDTILAAANPGVPKWSELSDDERRFCERSQEVYAGFIDHTDQQIGRLVSFLEARGQIENTLIVLLSDNGASPEGGPLGTVALNARKHLYHGPEAAEERREAIDRLGDKTTFPHYAFGWAQTSNTPLKWYKMNTYGGGVRSPLIMHWPAKIEAGALQTQFHHVIDVVPTVLEALNIKAPESYHGIPQMPVQGVSMKYSFNAADQPTRKVSQFFELAGDRAIWHRGWKAVTRHSSGTDFDADRWALYRLDQDFSECKDLSQEHPEKLKELIELWWNEAKTLDALPLDDKWAARSNVNRGAPPRGSYTFYPDSIVSTGSWRRISIGARIRLPPMSRFRTTERKASCLPSEHHLPATCFTSREKARLRVHFLRPGEVCRIAGRCRRASTCSGMSSRARPTIAVAAGCSSMAHRWERSRSRTWPVRAVQGGLTCGRDSGLAISDAYECPFIFTGIIDSVVVELGAEGKAGAEAAAMAVWPPPLAR